MRTISSIALLALLGCRDHGSQLDVDPEDDPAGADITDEPLIPEIGTAPEVAEEIRPSEFRWSPGRGELDLAPRLAGDKVETSKSDGWALRSAGGGSRSGYGGLGGLKMRRSRSAEGAVPSAAPSMGMGDGIAAEEDARTTSGPGRVAQQSLRAGSTDDNADFDAYLAFLGGWSASSQYPRLDVEGRRFIQVVDHRGLPVPGARVSVLDRDSDQIVWTGTTYGDGRLPFYPNLELDGYRAPGTPHGGWTIQATDGSATGMSTWDGSGELHSLVLEDSAARGPVKLDVVFLIDTTGSMGDEIDRIKSTLLSTTERLRGLDQEFDLRYGAVLYRDIGDEYLTRLHPLTGRIGDFDEALQGIQANGGGDGPESLNQGLAMAVGGMDWRDGAAKMVFLIADAPPHMDYQQDIPFTRTAAAAMHHGIKVHTVAASGLDEGGTLVFREVAQLTRGKFIFIEYGSVAASAESHGVTGQVQGNNLDAIFYREIKSELEGWGRASTTLASR